MNQPTLYRRVGKRFRRVVTLHDAAAAFGVSRQAIYDAVARGRIEVAARTSVELWLFADSVKSYFKERCHASS